MKRFKFVFLLIVVMVFLAGCINIPIGDGNKIKLSKEGLTITTEDGEEHTVNIDKDEENISVTGFGQEGDESLSFGKNLEMPKSLPTDVPLPKGIEVYQASNIQTVTSVSFQMTSEMETVFKIYEKHFASKIYSDQVDTSEIMEENFSQKSFHGRRSDGELKVVITEMDSEEQRIDVQIIFEKTE